MAVDKIAEAVKELREAQAKLLTVLEAMLVAAVPVMEWYANLSDEAKREIAEIQVKDQQPKKR